MTGRTEDYRASCVARSNGRAILPRPCGRSGSSTPAPTPIEGMRETLDKATGESPDDDRVWLALANLDDPAGPLRRGRPAGSRRCEQASPTTRPSGRPGSHWAQAAGRPGGRGASGRPSAGWLVSRTQVLLPLRAWLAGQAGDRQAERAGPRTAHRAGPGRDCGRSSGWRTWPLRTTRRSDLPS